MSITQSILENVGESDFYLVEHVFNNAIRSFCENITTDQIVLVNKYLELMNEGKMSKSLETELSKEISPYLEEYVDIYTPYLFANIQESDSDFNLADYRNKVGKDTILELFKSTGGKIASIGSALAAAAAATWAIKNPEEVSTAIDTILSKVKGDNEKVVAYVRHIFGMKDPNSATEILKKLADKQADMIKQTIDSVSDTGSSITSKMDEFGSHLKKIVSGAGSAVQSWIKKGSKGGIKSIMNKDFG